MMIAAHTTAQLGDVVVTAFDEAAHYSTDPRVVSRLATRAVMLLLRPAPAPSRLRPRSRRTP